MYMYTQVCFTREIYSVRNYYLGFQYESLTTLKSINWNNKKYYRIIYVFNSIYFYLFAFLDYASLRTMKPWCIFAAFWKLCWWCLRVLNDDRRNDHLKFVYIHNTQICSGMKPRFTLATKKINLLVSWTYETETISRAYIYGIYLNFLYWQQYASVVYAAIVFLV